VNPITIVQSLTFPPVQQPAFAKQVTDFAINNLVTARAVSRRRKELRTKSRRLLRRRKKEKKYILEVKYQVTVYKVNIEGLNTAFRQLATFASRHIRTVIGAILHRLAGQLSQMLWAELQQLSKQPLLKLKAELEERRAALSIGDQEVQGLDKKSQELSKAETVLSKFL